MKKIIWLISIVSFPFLMYAQGTSGTILGTISQKNGQFLSNAVVEAIHEPSGTKYKTISNNVGKFNLPGVRIGGPYKITVKYVGFNNELVNDVYVQLGDPTVVNFTLTDSKTDLQTVNVSTTRKGALISKDRKGTGTNINKQLLSTLPTLSRSITDFTKLTPQSNGTSFAGQDNRAINFTLDGSIYNNSFGLSNLNGGQTNSTPISLDAIEEIQVSISPYDLKSTGFVGGNINAVTKSGTNTFHGSIFTNNRNQGLVGTKAGDGTQDVTIANFDVKQFGVSLGGPIIKNKLFFFANYESEKRVDPSGAFSIFSDTNKTSTGTRSSDLNKLSTFLDSAFGYKTGNYKDYNYITQSDKALIKIDWNINDVHKFFIRGNILKSKRDVQISNSNVISGSRNTIGSVAYQNSNYEINNDIYSVIGQLNSRINNRFNNEFIVGYTENWDYRAIKGSPFPTVDIQNGSGSTFATFGVDPFTPNNKLTTKTFQISDNFTYYLNKHTISAGFNFESFDYANGFTPRINGIYTYANLTDFYKDAYGYLANPNRTANAAGVSLRYSNTYSNLAGGGAWIAETKARNLGFYIQDQIDINKQFNIVYGVRVDIPSFASSGWQNDTVDVYTFLDDKGNPRKFNTATLPTTKVQFNPRVGFNYDVFGDKKFQIRGGAGLFTGRPPFVFISNQVGNNGVQNGDLNIVTGGIKDRPFKPITPATWSDQIAVPGKPASTFNIAVTEPEFNFPQVFRINLGLDYNYKGIIFSAEVLYTSAINAIYYYNANQKLANGTFSGADNRPTFGGIQTTLPTVNKKYKDGAEIIIDSNIYGSSNKNIRIVPKISDVTVMKSGDYGSTINVTFKAEQPINKKGLGWMVAYNYGNAKDYINPGSIANSSWTGNRSVNGNNLPDLAYSDYDLRDRLILNVNYKIEVVENFGLTFSLFGERRTGGRFSYTYSGDLNGDGLSGNDLLYIPKDNTEMNFIDIKGSATNGIGVGKVLTASDQKKLFENYINQDEYLSSRRGQYAERNGALISAINRFDFSLKADFTLKQNKTNHNIEVRFDIFNIGNLLNAAWGVNNIVNQSSPLVYQGVNNSKVPFFTINPYNNTSYNYVSFRKGTTIGDVWQAQLGLRYTF